MKKIINWKKIVHTILLSTLSFTLFLCFSVPVMADSYLDEIQVYNITVDLRQDGTMDLVYHIEWKVLDDSSQGPLEWIKIGIPNQYADSFTALSSNIKTIDYYSDYGDYVRIDFDRSYYADEIISFDFSFHQTRMYVLNPENNTCVYDFTPGWFDECEVKSCLIKWNSANVINSDATTSPASSVFSDSSASSGSSVPANSYLTWSGSLAAGESIHAHVEYTLGTFQTSDEMQYEKTSNGSYVNGTTENSSDGAAGIFLFLLMPAVFFIVYFINRKNGKYRGGFGVHPFIGRGGGGGGGGCACVSSCACACACACAGGGRAGCSAKNFYRASVKTGHLKNEP